MFPTEILTLAQHLHSMGNAESNTVHTDGVRPVTPNHRPATIRTPLRAGLRRTRVDVLLCARRGPWRREATARTSQQAAARDGGQRRAKRGTLYPLDHIMAVDSAPLALWKP
ncbi:hypothetical protein SAMN05421505_14043 [Sinosporangium album]|uniref:Uncharacterized protein n=1 Tax=Sinosporangium album TaxID=504805 RepID=A0A1G8J1C1_9ACTN|nr:hypothetical protein SAMN05421505_14043 [Sinosporangium album]